MWILDIDGATSCVFVLCCRTSFNGPLGTDGQCWQRGVVLLQQMGQLQPLGMLRGFPGFSVLAPPVVQHGSTIRLEKAGERPWRRFLLCFGHPCLLWRLKADRVSWNTLLSTSKNTWTAAVKLLGILPCKLQHMSEGSEVVSRLNSRFGMIWACLCYNCSQSSYQMGTDAGNMTHTIPYAISLSLFFHVFSVCMSCSTLFVLLIF